jgi:hypothetical protein
MASSHLTCCNTTSSYPLTGPGGARPPPGPVTMPGTSRLCRPRLCKRFLLGFVAVTAVFLSVGMWWQWYLVLNVRA